jgi:hypothetical protein
MEYAAGVLALFGAIVGLRFRFRALLPIAVLVFLASLSFSLLRGLSVDETLLMILRDQALLQGGYFGGLVIRAIFRAVQRKLQRSSERCRSS